MVAHVSTASSNALISSPGRGADGVVRVRLGESNYGSGVLLYDGRHILTARHLIQGQEALLSTVGLTVEFETVSGTRRYTVDDVLGLSTWQPVSITDDLLLLKLSETAPRDAPRYALYREFDEIGQPFALIGYGVSGTGALGQTHPSAKTDLRRLAENRFDGEMSALKAKFGSALGWTPPSGSQLWADFDDGTAARDSTRFLTGVSDLGRGDREGLITAGDSGSPAFVQGKLAGIASYTFSPTALGSTTDVDTTSNSSFGEIGVWQRISYYQQWLDQNLRKTYPNAPAQPQNVQQNVSEGNAGSSYAYFLLQFHGVRSDPKDWLSVDYTTRDGTAKAGEDYLAIQGTLVLYPTQNQAVIAVEILGDTRPEPDETFYLDVSNPVGGSFGTGVVTLTAMRTIVNDDGIWA
jgi:hypothetical protein